MIFMAGFLLTQMNAYGILLSPEECIPLHYVGVAVGILLMSQAALV